MADAVRVLGHRSGGCFAPQIRVTVVLISGLWLQSLAHMASTLQPRRKRAPVTAVYVAVNVHDSYCGRANRVSDHARWYASHAIGSGGCRSVPLTTIYNRGIMTNAYRKQVPHHHVPQRVNNLANMQRYRGSGQCSLALPPPREYTEMAVHFNSRRGWVEIVW